MYLFVAPKVPILCMLYKYKLYKKPLKKSAHLGYPLTMLVSIRFMSLFDLYDQPEPISSSGAMCGACPFKMLLDL